ncbi:hypothetical protein BN1221_02508 [Brenneria goodwinii]|uniref:Uncharacterized protein n=1 Tax=Brenneria goodwinii TaxID=1109412 RepID=A0A0G4JWK0_9GAMM|nr:hypothetical protein BN1221_02508 [Brenneria goodwinii]
MHPLLLCLMAITLRQTGFYGLPHLCISLSVASGYVLSYRHSGAGKYELS